MKKPGFSVLLLALVVFFSAALVVQAVPPQPTTIYGKVQEGDADVPDGTSVTAWMGSTESIVTGTDISFPGTGVSINFDGCEGEVVTVLRQAGETQVISQDGYTSVYALDALGPSDWEPPADPATEGMSITLKISDTVAATTTWSMGITVPLSLTVDSLAGDLPYTPGNVTLLGQIWDISASCTGFTATLTFTYDESLLGDVDEADIAGMARYDPNYNRWEYVAGTVNTDARTITISDVTAFSQWQILASTPPAAIADLTVSRSGSDVVLDWSDVTQNIRGDDPGPVTYNVYRAANDPYFSPGSTYAITSSTTYTDSGAIDDPNTYYYVVTAMDTLDIESGMSDRVGKFMRTIEPGMNLVSLPLIPASTAIQDLIGTQLTGAPSELYADRIWIWDTDLQDYDYAWLIDGTGSAYDGKWWDGQPLGPSSIVLEPGMGFWVQSRQGSTQDLALLGAVSAVPQQPVTIVEGMQLIGSAYPMEMTLYEATLDEDGADGAPSELYADRVWYWDTDLQDYDYAWLIDGTGSAYDGKWWDGASGETTITLKPGSGYWFQRRGTGSFVWTHPMPVP